MKMLFKQGQKIKVRELADLQEKYTTDEDGNIINSNDNWFFVQEMMDYCGKSVTVAKVETSPMPARDAFTGELIMLANYYLIEEDKQSYSWREWMLQLDDVDVAELKMKEEIGL